MLVHHRFTTQCYPPVVTWSPNWPLTSDSDQGVVVHWFVHAVWICRIKSCCVYTCGLGTFPDSTWCQKRDLPSSLSCWDQTSWRNDRIDGLIGQSARGFKQDGGKHAIHQTAGTAGNFDGKSCSLVGEMETKIRNLPQGNWAFKETRWNEGGAAFKPHRRAVFGNLLKFYLLTRAWRPRGRKRKTSSRKFRQLGDRYGKVWWILSETRPSTHAAREILDSP